MKDKVAISVTKNEAGQILCVTQIDDEHRVLKVIAESARVESPTVLVFLEGGLVSGVVCDKPVTVKVIDYDTEGTQLEDGELTWIPQGDFSTVPACVDEPICEVLPSRVSEVMSAINAI